MRQVHKFHQVSPCLLLVEFKEFERSDWALMGINGAVHNINVDLMLILTESSDI